MPRINIAVVGAGPIGLEAALYAAELGHDVQVFERGRVADNVVRWGFVKLFSPVRLNTSPLGLRALRDAGSKALPADAAISGTDLVRGYLAPISRTPALRGRIHERHRVVQIGREHLGKGLPLGAGRAAHPFRLLVEGPDGERAVRADVVLDCSGTYGNANWLGTGNVPAPGERSAAARIAYTLRDVGGADRERYAGQRVLLAGSGHSAATALDALADLPGTHTTWITRIEGAQPCPLVPDDPLPGRDRLSRRANDLARNSDRVRFYPDTCVDALHESPDGLHVRLQRKGGRRTVVVDTVLAMVGYRPDASLYSELQVHECYATQGPMKLAAQLLGAGSADCLAESSAGPDALVHPEPDFYILGAKSYGRNSQFLIRQGRNQVREVFQRIQQRPDLDLYAADPADCADERAGSRL